jgi:hypothetical protein
MLALFLSVRHLCVYLFGSKGVEHIDFYFRPSAGLVAAAGAGCVFEITNPLDLLLHARNLMTSVLVVEVKSTPSFVMWLCFDMAELAERGVSPCRMIADDVAMSVFPDAGVCGWLVDKKRE